MGYIKKNVLAANDEIVLTVKKSRWCLFAPWLWGILGFWLLLIPTIRAIYLTIALSHTEYVVTKKKAYEKYGIINVHVDEIDFKKVENVTYNTSFWGKIFNYSNVSIQGANRNNVNFNGIKDGNSVRNEISRIADEAKA